MSFIACWCNLAINTYTCIYRFKNIGRYFWCFMVFYINDKYDWKYYKCTHIYMAMTGRVTYNNGDEVHNDLSRRVCQRHVSRVCRRNPIFYLDVVKMILRLIMSRTAWTLRRKNSIRQYKLSQSRGIVIETNANAAKRYCLLSRKSRGKNNQMHCTCISSQRCNSQGQVALSKLKLAKTC